MEQGVNITLFIIEDQCYKVLVLVVLVLFTVVLSTNNFMLKTDMNGC